MPAPPAAHTRRASRVVRLLRTDLATDTTRWVAVAATAAVVTEAMALGVKEKAQWNTLTTSPLLRPPSTASPRRRSAGGTTRPSRAWATIPTAGIAGIVGTERSQPTDTHNPRLTLPKWVTGKQEAFTKCGSSKYTKQFNVFVVKKGKYTQSYQPNAMVQKERFLFIFVVIVYYCILSSHCWEFILHNSGAVHRSLRRALTAATLVKSLFIPRSIQALSWRKCAMHFKIIRSLV